MRNEHGSVIVFVTLMIVLLLIMVGMGLDTGQLTYTRSQGQAAVDAAALAAVSGIPSGSATEVNQRVAAFNSTNDYVKKSSNPIGSANITYIQYNEITGAIDNLPGITNANGVRVALEQNNPYTGTAPGTGINTPVFLTPLMKLFGQSAPATADVNVSAVAVLKALPGVPIAVMSNLCSGSGSVRLRDANESTDNSCWTTYTDASKTVQTLFEASASCSGLPANTDQITIGTSIGLNDDTSTPTYQDAASFFCPGGTCAKCWIAPVIPNGSCSSSASISDWARICPSEVKLTATDKYIKATVSCNQTLFRVDHNLCFSPRLVRDSKSGM